MHLTVCVGLPRTNLSASRRIKPIFEDDRGSSDGQPGCWELLSADRILQSLSGAITGHVALAKSRQFGLSCSTVKRGPTPGSPEACSYGSFQLCTYRWSYWP